MPLGTERQDLTAKEAVEGGATFGTGRTTTEEFRFLKHLIPFGEQIAHDTAHDTTHDTTNEIAVHAHYYLNRIT